MLSFLLEYIWIGIDEFLLNFSAAFGSVLGLLVAVTFGSVLGLQVTVELHVNSRLQPPTHWEPFVASTMLRCLEQPKKESNRRSSSIIAIAIANLTRFTLLLLLGILRYMWCNYVATWANNNSGKNLDLNKILFTYCICSIYFKI